MDQFLGKTFLGPVKDMSEYGKCLTKRLILYGLTVNPAHLSNAQTVSFSASATPLESS